MCGIVGIWDTRRQFANVRHELEQAMRSLRHRGPDDTGTWANNTGVGFGFNRLAIIDLSSAGHQPMTSADGRYVVMLNGEIYNYAEVRKSLVAAGRNFVSQSDTEVILHAFDLWGSSAVEKFIGMFAIAHWDEKEQTLELVRDRIGVKPLYFGWREGTICFASELKALRAFSHWTPSVNRQALGEFLQYGYISEERSIYDGIHKLLPGHRLRLKRGGQPVIERYWSVLDALDSPLRANDREIEEELESLLIDAARYRMVSDVPVGVYLSGGIDSSLITALLSRHHEQQIRTFTIGFREDSHDESGWARGVAQHCGTEHTEYILEPIEALEIAKDWGRLFDEPFGDSSGIPTLLVSKLARQEVKVVLSADGGDELFSGYNVYTGVLNRLERVRRIPRIARWISSAALSLATARPIQSLLSTLPIGEWNRGDKAHQLRRIRSMLLEPTIGRLFDLDKSYWTTDEVNRLIGGYCETRRTADAFPGTDAEKMGLWDFHHYLPEDILTKVDRMTMAVGIEGREPLLDHRLAEYSVRMPPHLKRGALGSKHVLKSILYRYVPRHLLERRKHGFGIPLDRWLRNELKSLVMEYLSESRVRAEGHLDWKMVSTLTREFYAGSQRLKSPLWYLLGYEMWREHWL
jgi:asparagine synthase (glutamine-hydrolysing)